MEVWLKEMLVREVFKEKRETLVNKDLRVTREIKEPTVITVSQQMEF